MTKRNDYRLGISMPKALHRHAKITAYIYGHTLSFVIQHMLRLFIHQPGLMDIEAPEPTDDLGPDDLSELHDKIAELLE